MPEINATLINQELNAVVEEQEAVLNGEISEEGLISGVVEKNEEELSATISTQQETLNTMLTVKGTNQTASLNVHYGVDGKPGKDGFSPTISVYKETKKEYILKITNKDNSYLTPNLMPDIDEILGLDEKVDKDLTLYTEIEPTILNAKQRDETLLYAYDANKQQPLSVKITEIALKKEVDQQIKRKLQTVKSRAVDWEVGDYIFLEIQEESD